MPYRRSDWHERLWEVWGEYRAARTAINTLKEMTTAAPDLLKHDRETRLYLRSASRNLEGTYIVRLYAAFEAALRSFGRARHADSSREIPSGVLIDEIGGKRGRGISSEVRRRAHEVRRVRNFWAHEEEIDPGPMSVEEARSRLQTFLCELPDHWD